MNHSSQARLHMIESQILTGNLLDAPILQALGSVPREYFVPAPFSASAYGDEELPLGKGRYLLEPLVFGRMLALAGFSADDRVLDLACGTGYSTAVIAQLAGEVTGVDHLLEAEQGAQHFAKLGITNARMVKGEPAQGYPAGGPYDVIFINGAVQQLPEALMAQLAENGRLVATQQLAARTGSSSGLGRALLLVKRPGNLVRKSGFDASVPLIAGFETKPHFVF